MSRNFSLNAKQVQKNSNYTSNINVSVSRIAIAAEINKVNKTLQI